MREDEGGQKEQYGFLEFVGVNVQRGRELAGERGGEKGGEGGSSFPRALARVLYVCCTRLLARSLERVRAHKRTRT